MRALDTTKRAVTRSRGMRLLESDDIGRAVVAAIRAARDEELLSAESRAWVGRIEMMRARLNASTREIARVDFGAGRTSHEHTVEQGVLVMETLGEVSRTESKSPFWCRFLFALVRAAAPESGIEVGSAVGVSAAYQATAFRLNKRGRFAALEGSAALAEEARSNLRGLGLETVDVVAGPFADTLPEVLTAREPLDHVFVAGHRDGDATLAYFEMLLPHLASRATVVFDEIAWSEGMRQAWNRIARDDRVALAIDLGSVGVVLLDARSQRPRRYRVPLH